MRFQKRHVIGIAIVFLLAVIVMEAIRGNIDKPISFDSYGLTRLISDFGVAITATFLFAQFYIHMLWRFDPFCLIPVLKKQYTGTIAYLRKGVVSTIEIKIKVKQVMDRVRLDMSTPLMQSRTLNGCFVEEKGLPVLYYVFNTEPLTLDPNPGERRTGAARLIPNENDELEGYYWTDQGNRGRLYFYTANVLVNASHNGSRYCSGPDDSDSSAETSSRTIIINNNLVGVQNNCLKVKANQVIKLCKLLKNVSNDKGSDFAGLGLMLVDDSFDFSRVVSMRPQSSAPEKLSIYSETGKQYLLEISNKNSELHDGYVVCNPEGEIEKVSQYLFPPSDNQLSPDAHRGSRSFSALCGSTLQGVHLVGIVSEDGSYAIYEQGKCIFDSRVSSREGSLVYD